MTETINCIGSGEVAALAFQYTAKTRKMHMLTCPTCGREFRRQGSIRSQLIPEHA